MSSLEPVSELDIVGRLRREQASRNTAITLARGRAYADVAQQEEWVRDLVRDAANEIELLRENLSQIEANRRKSS